MPDIIYHPDGRTLAELTESLSGTTDESAQVLVSEIEVFLEAETPTIKVKDVEVPATAEGIDAIATYVQIPSAFMGRMQTDEQQFMLERLLKRQGGNVAVGYTESGVTGLFDPGALVLTPRSLLGIAARVLGDDALVIESVVNNDRTIFDLVVEHAGEGAVGFPKGTVENPRNLGEGDFTRSGLRIMHDRQRGTAPTVSGLSYTLACTNGMETGRERFKIDARGQSVEEVLADLEASAVLAFAAAEEAGRHLYSLQEQTVSHPERVLRRMAQEQGIPARTQQTLLDRIPTLIEEGGSDGSDLTMYDLVGLITNEANRSGMRLGARHTLQRGGGNITSAEVTRCVTCSHKL